MEKLSLTGQDLSKLIDCSEAVPQAKRLTDASASFPAGTNLDDVEQSCPSPFPSLSTNGVSHTAGKSDVHVTDRPVQLDRPLKYPSVSVVTPTLMIAPHSVHVDDRILFIYCFDGDLRVNHGSTIS